MSVTNNSLIFNKIPAGLPVPGETLKKVASTINLDADLPAGAVLTKTLTLSLDPYLRGRMRPIDMPSYAPAFPLNEPINNFGVSVVLKSNNPGFNKGDHIYGVHLFSEYQIFVEEALAGVKILENKEKLPWSTWVGAAGMPGQTAWYGLNNIAHPKKGETIFISGACGPVGAMVAQLCQRLGLKVIGSAGSSEKVAYLKDVLKFDAAWNYKTAGETEKQLKANPFEIYWDHTGGETLDQVLAAIKPGGRIVACGAISGYNGEANVLHNSIQILVKYLTIKGFIVIHHDLSGFYADIPHLIASGEIKPPLEHITKGLDNGEEFVKLLTGGNFGKSVITFE